MKKSIFFVLSLVVMTGLMAQTNPITGFEGRPVDVIVTAKDTMLQLSFEKQVLFAPFGQPLETEPAIFVDPSKTFQTFIGIGGALTDAAAETFAKLPRDKQVAFIESCFSKTRGIGYSFARTTIHSSDFSSESYTYVQENDASLGSFRVDHDTLYRIPFIKEAIAMAGGTLPVFASPWSPPAWMKDNNNMLRGGKLLPSFYQTWADYFVHFIKSYENHGIPILGITVQNEPMATQTWESCIYTAEEERDFIKNYLGPTFERNGLSDKKIIAWDHNRDLIYHRVSTIMSDPEAARYVWGIGFHWYESWTGAAIPENIQRVAESYPDKPLLLTEACNYPFSWDTFDQWHWGEKYGEAMIHDFNNGAVAWTDWNILLDETGGPNHVGNFCFAPVHADTREGTLHYMNSYYYIGHFSRYIQPGARRISCSPSRAQLLTTGFQNPDGSIAVVVMNQGEAQVNFRMYVSNQAVEVTSRPHSIMTLVF